ncbi:hypothetical protein BVRB_4g092110 isoform B [Beta vulgaris subsp. vulgaris]|nr:hypothetical protein BVRB_4g092110 isoform B [Beta vulgaris subsp. vulgaris]
MSMSNTMSMDARLERAARCRDVKFLREATASRPREYFLRTESQGYNIFHVAVRGLVSIPFIEELVERLPKQDVQLLLSQQATPRKWNPLHFAALWGSLELLKLLLSVYPSSLSSSSSSSSSEERPWLARATDGRTPLHSFLEYNEEKCGLEILSRDLRAFCGIVEGCGNSLLYHAVNRGFSRFALKILKSNYSFSVRGLYSYNPIHVMARCSEEVWKLLYNKYPEMLLVRIEDETTVMHVLAKEGALRPLLSLEKTIDNNSLKNLCRLENSYGDTPLHIAIEHEKQDFALCLVEICGTLDPPLWQCKSHSGVTPIDLALDKCWENLVVHFISNYSWSYKETNDCWKRRLSIAIEKGMHKVAEKICSNVDLQLMVGEFVAQSSNLTEKSNAQNVLHFMLLCPENIWRLLYQKNPEIIHVTGENGTSILHEWAKKGELWPLQLLEEVSIKSLEKLSLLADDNGDIPLHVAIKHDSEEFALFLVVKLCRIQDPHHLWRQENNDGFIPFELALHHHLENVVLHIIAKDPWTYKERSSRGESRLFIAVENGMDQVVQNICGYVAANSTRLIIPTANDDGRTIMYVLSNCTETTAKLLLKTFPHLITELDQNGKRPIDIASEFGVGWLTKLLITKDPSSIAISPNVWIELCKRGHLEAIEAFIIHYDDFRQLCIEQEESPLHCIKLTTYQDYEKFLAIPLIWEMKNRRDFDGKTPLHRALEREDILFAEVLLQKGVNRSIRDKRRKTATKLLAQLCDQYYEWEEMSQRVGINPRLRNLGSSAGEMRTTLSVVAALLATLTFAAAYTVPGGFDQNSGEIILIWEEVEVKLTGRQRFCLRGNAGGNSKRSDPLENV